MFLLLALSLFVYTAYLYSLGRGAVHTGQAHSSLSPPVTIIHGSREHSVPYLPISPVFLANVPRVILSRGVWVTTVHHYHNPFSLVGTMLLARRSRLMAPAISYRRGRAIPPSKCPGATRQSSP
jgi:hypothetical protein